MAEWLNVGGCIEQEENVDDETSVKNGMTTMNNNFVNSKGKAIVAQYEMNKFSGFK
jgi:hypothetical protein